jgi:hypothetical protein
MWADSILILVISVFTALLGEGLTWLLVYRTEKYQKLKVEIERQTKKLEKKKEAHGDATLDRTQKRKMDREEERLKSTNRDLVHFLTKGVFLLRSKWLYNALKFIVLYCADKKLMKPPTNQSTSILNSLGEMLSAAYLADK